MFICVLLTFLPSGVPDSGLAHAVNKLVFSDHRGPNSENNKDTLIIFLAYFNEDIVRSSLDSIISGSSGQPFSGDIVVIEQQSKHSHSINETVHARKKKRVTDGGAKGLGVLHHILVTGKLQLFGELWKLPFVHSLIEVSKYRTMCLTDGDVIMYGDWLSEILFLLQTYPDVALAAVSLNPINNIDPLFIVDGPVHEHYIDAPTGMQMVCFRANDFRDLLAEDVVFRDDCLQNWTRSRGKSVVRTRRNQLIHMMWSVYAEKNGAHAEYLELKEAENKANRLWGRNVNAVDANFTKLF